MRIGFILFSTLYMLTSTHIVYGQSLQGPRHVGYPQHYQVQYIQTPSGSYPKIVTVADTQASQKRRPLRRALQKPVTLYEQKPYYVSTHIGASWMNISDISNTSEGTSLASVSQESIEEQSFAWSGAFGYNLQKYKIPLRTEVSFTYRPELDYIQAMTFRNAANPSSHQSSVRSYSLMTNIFYDYELTPRIKPFIGAGIGLAFNKTEGRLETFDGSVEIDYRTSETNFSWNLMAGLAYQLSEDFSLEGMYRYADLGTMRWIDAAAAGLELTSENMTDHQILVGVKYHF